ncbi:MAG TPA: ABC transporter ATP-binding protein [Acidilobales archaeon]|nr:ABC transporter ATP-binding protein [Acidilobales archaeon]
MHGIEVNNLVKRYIVKEGLRRKRVVEALKGISFHVKKGSIHALLGPNGAGKTTTIKILSTLLLPDGGEAKVLGFDVVRDADKVRKVIGVVLDVSKGFYMSLSGYENLVFYGLLKGLPLSDARRRVKEVLEIVGLESMKASNRPYYTYSLGMRARLAFAKVLLTNPEVLLLDEPTLGLDVESARAVRELMQKLAKEGRTILVTGHNMFEIEQIADNVTIINEGRVIAQGTPSELKERVGLIHKVSIKISSGNVRQFVNYLKDSLPIERLSYNTMGNTAHISAYVKAGREHIAQVVFDLARRYDAKILDLSIIEPSLEDTYIAIVKGGGSA